MNRVIDFLFHTLKRSGIDFVLSRDEIENGLKGLSFRPESHRLVKAIQIATWNRERYRGRIGRFRILIGEP
jgi:hypothetical protein